MASSSVAGLRASLRMRRFPALVAGGGVVVILAVAAILAPYISGDPVRIDPVNRLQPPSAAFWFGTDNLGRDMFARTLHGGRISLFVGLSVALMSSMAGLAIGLASGFFRRADVVIMRIVDGMMAIPAILLAIALMALTKSSVENVVFVISVAEIPRVVRLVRGLVLSLRSRPFVDAAIVAGSRDLKILVRHILPNTLAPVIVQATFIAASAVIVEASLSFLGVGTPPESPSWGGAIADGRSYFLIAPWIVFVPGIFLGLFVLGINILGDGLRDSLDPRMARNL
jgi:peptide/nickel transport system permease protein